MDDGLNAQFEKFTERARKTLRFAQEGAQLLNHRFIGTEHILLGLAREGDSVAVHMLVGLGAEPARVSAAIKSIIDRGDRPVQGEIGLTKRAKHALQLAVDEARRMGHHYVGTEHILLGLIRESDGIAGKVLEGEFGITLELARHELQELMIARLTAQPESEQPTPPTSATSAPKNNVVTCRLDDAAVSALDALVEAGIRSTRSDAAAWLINAGIASHRELFERVNATVNEIRKLRLEARDIARQVANGGESAQGEEPGDSGQTEEPPEEE